MLVGEGAKAMADNEGGAADVLRDLYAAKGMYGPLQQLLDAKNGDERLEAAKNYGRQMLPLMAGVGATHALTGVGAKLHSRAQMLELRRSVEADIERMDLDDEAKAQFRRMMDGELEQLSPSHREDARRLNREQIQSALGDRALGAIKAEALSGKYLADAPGNGLQEKLDNIAAAYRDDPEGASTELVRDHDLAMALEQLRRTEDPEVADQIVGEIEQIMGDNRPLDQVTSDARLREGILDAEDPGRHDSMLESMAEDTKEPWTPVGRDPDTGDVTLRRDRPGDAPVRRRVPESELGQHRLNTATEAPRWAADLPDWDKLASGELSPKKWADRASAAIDARGQDSWKRLSAETPELRGKRKKATKKQLQQALLRRAKEAVGQAPKKGGAQHLRRSRDILTEIEQMGGLSPDEWARSGIDMIKLRDHPRARRLIRSKSQNRWGHVAESLRDEGWFSGRGNAMDEAAGSGGHEGLFIEVMDEALGGERLINPMEHDGGLGPAEIPELEAMHNARFPESADAEDPDGSVQVVDDDPAAPKVVPDRMQDALEAVAGGAESTSELADKLGVSRHQASQLLRQAHQLGLVDKEGTGRGTRYTPSQEALGGHLRESEARDIEAQDITDRLIDDATSIAWELDRTGSSLTLDERVDRMARDIADYGDLVRPEDPQVASINLAARVLQYVPKEHRSDELIRQLGMGSTDVAEVRRQLQQLETPTPPARQQSSLTVETMSTLDAVLEGRTRLDLAMERPVLEGLPDDVRMVYDEARRAGADEADAAEQAFQTWREGNPDVEEGTLEAHIGRHREHLDHVHTDILSGDAGRHGEGIEQLSNVVGDIRMLDEWPGLLSLSERGREYLRRLNSLWHQVVVKNEVVAMPGLEKPRRVKDPAERRRKAEKLAAMRTQGSADAYGGTGQRRTGEPGDPEFGGGSPFAPAAVLIAPSMAAWALLRAGARTFARVWRGAWRLAGAAIRALKAPASRLRDIWTGKTKLERRAQRYEWRSDTAISRNVGKRKKGMGIVDNLTLWGEPDLIFDYERSALYAKIAHEATARLERVVREDSDFDHQLNQALEILGTAREKRRPDQVEWLDTFEKGLSDDQRDVVDGLRTMYGALRQLVAGELLPTQQQRRRDIALLRDLVAERRAVEEEFRQAWSEAHEDDHEPAIRSAKRALDKATKAREEAEQRLDRLRAEGAHEKARWGITDRGFAPAVPNRDPAEGVAEARSLGKLSEDEIRDIDVQQALRDLAGTRKELEQRAHDWIASEIPAAPRAGHWMRRRDVLEKAGMREQSAVRSFFHYVKEVYRLIPAAQFHEKHYARLWGEEKWVGAAELETGELAGGGHIVEFIGDRVASSIRRRTKWRLAGRGFGLAMTHKDGGKTTLWFRNLKDWKSARDSANTPLFDKLLGQDWTIDEKQSSAKHYLLVHHQARAGADVEALPAIGEDPATKRLLLSTHDLKAVLPTQAVGNYVKRVGGKYASIRRLSGKQAANDFAAYIEQGMQRMMGRELLTKAERWAAGFSASVRHKLLGMLQPSSAAKEMLDNFLSTAIHSGVEGAMDASNWSLEFSRRLRVAEQQLHGMKFSEWMAQHTPNQRGQILPPAMLEAMQTPKDKLDKMMPEARAEARIIDEAYVAFLKSALSGDSINEHLGVVRRREGYGQKLYVTSGPQQEGVVGKVKHALDATSRVAHAAGDASWFLRRRAQSYGMRMTWMGAYITARKAGRSAERAFEVANNFALAQGNVGNRLSQGEAFQNWFGRLVKPLASWSLAVSSTNWRQLFHSPPGTRVQAATSAAKRLAYFGAQLLMLQQLGMFFELDTTNSTGGKLSQVPLVGPMAAYSTQKLLSMAQLAADPDDASRELPQWRRDLRDAAREHAPAILREWLVSRAETVGTFPADVPLPVMVGTWAPYVSEAAQDVYTALTTPDKQRAAQAWSNVLTGNFDWMRAWNRLYGTMPDTNEPNYELIKNQHTGHMQERVRKGDEWSAVWNLLMPDMETSIQRLERGVLQPRRDQLRGATSRNAAYEAQKLLIQADMVRDQLPSMQDPREIDVARRRIADLERGFMRSAQEFAAEKELDPRATVSLIERWTKVARSNLTLTSKERDIINAFDADSAFRLWAGALDASADPMTRSRFNRVMALRYSDPRAMFNSLSKQSRDTVDRFMRAYKTANVRWSMESEKR